MIVVEFDGGWIGYYPESRGFLAVCRAHSQGDRWCYVFKPSEGGRALARGRPLGTQLCWLKNHYGHCSCEAHMGEKRAQRKMRLDEREGMMEREEGRALQGNERRLRYDAGHAVWEEDEPRLAA